jgi:hypothetical protein
LGAHIVLFQLRFAVQEMLAVWADCVGLRLLKMSQRKKAATRSPTISCALFALAMARRMLKKQKSLEMSSRL